MGVVMGEGLCNQSTDFFKNVQVPCIWDFNVTRQSVPLHFVWHNLLKIKNKKNYAVREIENEFQNAFIV